MPVSALIRRLAPLLAAATILAGCGADGRPTAPGTGELTVTVVGLPQGVSASVNVAGPGNFAQAVSRTTTLTDLAPGDYTLTATTVSANDTSYLPSPTSSTVTVSASSRPASATVDYANENTSLDLTIGAMYLVQSTQTLAGTVPLVQDRDGFLRVFVVANQTNGASPQVRVRFYLNGTQQGDPVFIDAPRNSVPTSIDQSSLNSSWNVAVPGSLIQPSLSILADVDPTASIPETRHSNNSFPTSGTPQPLTVKPLSTLFVRFVPVLQSATSLTGNVNSSNVNDFLSKAYKIHPISTYSADVHATYTSSAHGLTGSNSNGAWQDVLGEIEALRVAEGSSRNYFGIAKVAYIGGIVGISYIGGLASVGYDGSTSFEIVSHELGHSFGRQHAPCGINGNTDPSYPYPAGNIGVYGFDVATNTIYPPSTAEVMSYCHPQWISDYTYTGVYAYRSAHPSSASDVGASVEPCLIVWGHIANGAVVLEPSFQALTHPRLPESGGAYALRALDASGATVFSLSFAGDTIADAPGAGRSFTYSIPIARMTKPVASLALSGPNGSVRRTSASIVAATSNAHRTLDASLPFTLRRAAGGVRLAWNAARYPLVVVRDAGTGEILSLARDGASIIATTKRDFELTLSDGVASTVIRSHVTQ